MRACWDLAEEVNEKNDCLKAHHKCFGIPSDEQDNATEVNIDNYSKFIQYRTTLYINYVDFLQFQRYFTPQAELEEAFIYKIHKPIDFSIDFSCRLKTYLSSYGH